jgi:hypothetical protein
LEGYPFIVADPDTDSPEPLRRAKQARAHSQALRNQVAEAAEAVAEVEQEAARLHQALANPSGPYSGSIPVVGVGGSRRPGRHGC